MSEHLVDSLVKEIELSGYKHDDILELFSPPLIASLNKLLKGLKAITLTEFIKAVLKLLPATLTSRAKISHGLLKLFQDICRTKNDDNFTWAEFTSFLAAKTSQLSESTMIQEKVLPFGMDIDRHTKHKIKPPQVIGASKSQLRRLKPTLANSDKMHHLNRRIEKACYSKSRELFFVVDFPSRYVEVLDRQYNRKFRVTTTQEVSEKEALIVSLHWSEASGRLGCVFSNFSTSFWSFDEEFRVELSCPLEFKHIRHPPNRLFCVDSELQWLKIDSRPVIYILDEHTLQIKDTFQHSKLKRFEDSAILLGEVLYHHLLILAFEKSILLILLSKKEVVTTIETLETNIFTMCFNEMYQSLVVGCFESYIHCFELSEFCDLTEKGKLIGNMQLPTALAAIPDSPVIVSIQSNSVLKLWNLADCSCFQFFNTYKNLQVRQIIPMKEGVVLVGSKLLEFCFQLKNTERNKESILSICANQNLIQIITSIHIYFYSCESGWPVKIIRHAMEDSCIAMGLFILSHNYAVLVSEECLLKLVDSKDGATICEMPFKQKRPITLEYDQTLDIISLGTDESIYIIQFYKNQHLLLRRTLKVSPSILDTLTVSPLHNLMVFSCQKDNALYMYTFQKLQPLKYLKLSDNPEQVKIAPQSKMVVVQLKREVLLLIYSSDPTHKASIIVTLARRLTTSQMLIDKFWLISDTLYLSSLPGLISKLDISDVSKEEVDQSVIKAESFSAYRELQEQHHSQNKETAVIHEEGVETGVVPQEKLYNHHLRQIHTMSDLLLIGYDNGYVKLYDQEWSLKGSINIRESFPESWKPISNHNTIRGEVKLILDVLAYLRINEPSFREHFAVQSSSEWNIKPREEAISIRKSLSVQKSPPSSLRQVKILLERQREDAKNEEKYNVMLSKTRPDKYFKNKKAIEETKDILRFFNKDFVVEQTERPKKMPELMPPSVRDLESRLVRVMEDYFTQTKRTEDSEVRKKKHLQVTRSRRASMAIPKEKTEFNYLKTDTPLSVDTVSRQKGRSLSLPKLRPQIRQFQLHD